MFSVQDDFGTWHGASLSQDELGSWIDERRRRTDSDRDEDMGNFQDEEESDEEQAANE